MNRVIIVDDEPDLRFLVSHYLRRFDFEVLEAATGEEAFAAALRSGGAIDALVTDARLPGMSGLQVIHGFKHKNPGIKTILISGAYDQNFESKATDAYLPKPFSMNELVKTLQSLLESRHAHREESD